MTTRITQVDGQTEKLTTLRVEGSLRLADAELLESTYLELRAKQISFGFLRLCVGNLLAIALVATTFGSAQAQTNNEKPIQTPERGGVETADALPLSLNEAIRLALENNNDIRTSRIDVEKAEFNLTARRGAYDPRLFSETYFERSSTPVASSQR